MVAAATMSSTPNSKPSMESDASFRIAGKTAPPALPAELFLRWARGRREPAAEAYAVADEAARYREVGRHPEIMIARAARSGP
jgi:hypothetical protein